MLFYLGKVCVFLYIVYFFFVKTQTNKNTKTNPTLIVRFVSFSNPLCYIMTNMDLVGFLNPFRKHSEWQIIRIHGVQINHLGIRYCVEEKVWLLGDGRWEMGGVGGIVVA